jgi:hypothetical protein
MVERRVVYTLFVGKSEGKNQLRDPGVDGRIIFSGSRIWWYYY